MTADLIAPRGLKGLVVAETSVGDVRGDEGFYHYRQYDATELARLRSVEDVWALLIDGALPEPGDTTFSAEVRSLRELPEAALAVIDTLAALPGDLMTRLSAAVLAVAATDGVVPSLDQTTSERRRCGLRLAALVPVILARLWRVGRGEEPIPPASDLGHAANLLWMVNGVRPTADATRLIETYVVTTMDHGFNASTFATRVITSTGTDLAGAVSGGLAALAGPLHGGAPSRALEMIEEIGEPSNTRRWLDRQLAAQAKVMGFGHAVYRTGDPRARLLHQVAAETGDPLVDRAAAIEHELLAGLAAARPDATIATNVEYYAGVVMHLAGLPRELFTPTFAVGRCIGWIAHALEQAADGKILRPSAAYVGPPPPVPVPPAVP